MLATDAPPCVSPSRDRPRTKTSPTPKPSIGGAEATCGGREAIQSEARTSTVVDTGGSQATESGAGREGEVASEDEEEDNDSVRAHFGAREESGLLLLEKKTELVKPSLFPILYQHWLSTWSVCISRHCQNCRGGSFFVRTGREYCTMHCTLECFGDEAEELDHRSEQWKDNPLILEGESFSKATATWRSLN